MILTRKRKPALKSQLLQSSKKLVSMPMRVRSCAVFMRRISIYFFSRSRQVCGTHGRTPKALQRNIQTNLPPIITLPFQKKSGFRLFVACERHGLAPRDQL